MARNRGVEEAKADFIAFLDADDEWMPDFLESMVACFRQDPAASVCYSCAQAIDDDGRKLPAERI